MVAYKVPIPREILGRPAAVTAISLPNRVEQSSLLRGQRHLPRSERDPFMREGSQLDRTAGQLIQSKLGLQANGFIRPNLSFHGRICLSLGAPIPVYLPHTLNGVLHRGGRYLKPHLLRRRDRMPAAADPDLSAAAATP